MSPLRLWRGSTTTPQEGTGGDGTSAVATDTADERAAADRAAADRAAADRAAADRAAADRAAADRVAAKKEDPPDRRVYVRDGRPVPDPGSDPAPAPADRKAADRKAADRKQADGEPAGREPDAPDKPTQLPAGSWWGVLRRTFREYSADDLSDRAAALTYYGVLSIFPALLVLVSLIGLTGQNAKQTLVTNLGTAAPGSVRGVISSAITTLANEPRAAGILAIVGLLGAIWSASGYIAAFMRAANIIYDVPEGRPVWKKYPVRLGITVVMMLMIAATAIGVVFTGGLARRAGSLLGLGNTAVLVWDIAKWPVLILIVAVMIALLYWAAPNVRQEFRWVSPGSILAIVLWLVASGAFAFYVANFGKYNKIYGSVASVIIFLVWLWISNLAILFGAELNAELERGRAMMAGHPADVEPYVELRDQSKSPVPQG